MRLAVVTLAAFAGGYVALSALIYFMQPYLLFLPLREIAHTPDLLGLAYEPVKIKTEDRVELDAWYVPAPNARATLLFFHGNAGNISHRLDSIAIFHRLRLNVLIFDYRGYGRSQGEPSEEGTYRDAAAAWRYLTDTRAVPAGRIVVFGRSLGGAIAAYQAARAAPGALIVESSFASAPEIAKDLYFWLPTRLLTRFRYDTAGALRAVQAPVLIVHSPQDEIIPFRHAKLLIDAAREPKRLLELTGDHNGGFLISGPRYTSGLDSFLSAHFGR